MAITDFQSLFGDRPAPNLTDTFRMEPVPPPKRGLVSSALETGVHSLAGLTGSAAEAVGRRVGLPSVEEFGRGVAANQLTAAAQSARPDLEVMPWEEGGGGWSGALPWAAYQTIKNAPLMAAQIAAAKFVPEALVPSSLGRLGAIVPQKLGGGAGMAAEAAAAAGQDWAKNVVGASVAGYPVAVGSMYEEAKQGGHTSQQDLDKVFGMAAPYAAMDALGPAQATGLLKRGPGEGFVKGAAKAAGFGALSEMPQEAAQTAMEQSFRDDLPIAERARNVVNAALTGAVTGGLMGGVASGVGSAVKAVRPESTTDEIDEQVKNAVEPPAPESVATAVSPVEPEEGTAAQAASVEEGADELGAEPAGGVAADLPLAEQPASKVFDGVLEERAFAPSRESIEALGEKPVGQALQEIYTRKLNGETLDASDIEVLRAFKLANPSGTPASKKNVESALARETAKFEALSKKSETVELSKVEQVRMDQASINMDRYAVALNAFDTVNAAREAEAAARKDAADADLKAVEAANKIGLGVSQEVDPATAQSLEGVDWAKPAARKTDFQYYRDTKGQFNDGDRVRITIEGGQPVEGQLVGRRGREELVTERGGALNFGSFFNSGKPVKIEVLDAAQKSVPTSMDVGQRPADGETLGVGNVEGVEVAGARQAETATDQEGAAQKINPLLDKLSMPGPAPNEALDDASVAQQVAAQAVQARKATIIPLAVTSASKSGTPSNFDNDLADVLKSLPEPLRQSVEVIDNPEKWPDPIKDQAVRMSMDLNGISGALYEGKVLIGKEANTSREEIEGILAHEIIHGGANAYYGADRDAVMEHFIDRAGGIEGALDVARRLGAERIDITPYMVGGTTSGAEKARLMDEIFAHAAQILSPETIQQKANQETARLQRPLAKWIKKVRDAVSEAFDAIGFKKFAARIKGLSPGEFAQEMVKMRAAAESGASMRDQVYEREQAEDQRLAVRSPTLKDMSDTAQSVIGSFEKVLQNLPGKLTMQQMLNGATLEFMPFNHVKEIFGKYFPVDGGRTNALELLDQSYNTQNTIRSRVAALAQSPARKLQSLSPKMQEHINSLMALSVHGINPAIPFDSYKAPDGKTAPGHDWLQKTPMEAELRKLHAEGVNTLNFVNRDKVAKETYQELRAYNQFENAANYALALHYEMTKDPLYSGVYGAKLDPLLNLIGEAAAHDNVVTARDSMLAEVKKLTDAIRKFAEKHDLKSTDKERKEREITQRLLREADKIDKNIAHEKLVPYFHVGRDGDYRVTFKLKTTDKGNVSVPDAERLIKLLEDSGYDNVAIAYQTNNANAYILTETIEQSDRLAELLRKSDVIDTSTLKKGDRYERDLDPLFGKASWLDKVLGQIDDAFMPTEDMTKKDRELLLAEKEKVRDVLKSSFAQLSPINSLMRVMRTRKGVQGFSKNFAQSYLQRAQTGSYALANIASSELRAKAFQHMQDAVRVASMEPGTDVYPMTQVTKAMRARDAANTSQPTSDIWQNISNLANAGYLATPAFIVTQYFQPVQLTGPELSKKVGYVGAFNHMKAAAGIAHKITQAIKAEMGASGSYDATVTTSALTKALEKDHPKLIQMLIDTANRGKLDLSSQVRSLARAASGKEENRVEKFLNWATHWGYRAETFTRLLAAISANSVYDEVKSNPKTAHKIKGSREQYIDSVIDQSLYDYSPHAQARYMSRDGMFGRAGQLMFKFQSFWINTLAKLGRETYNAIAGDDPQTRVEARTFILGHAIAMAATAGVMGLPFVTALAGAYDKLKDFFDGDYEPSDIKRDFRMFLSNTFGKTVGELIAHGGFRGLGVDLSGAIGLQDLLPMSRLLQDRRKISDALGDYALSEWGPVAGIPIQILKGVEQMSHGNLVEGFAMTLPRAPRGAVKGLQTAWSDSFTENGKELPVDATLLDAILQMGSFRPADLAEYQEEARSLKTSQNLVRGWGSDIRKGVVSGILDNDTDAVAEWMNAMRQFDMTNPESAVGPRLGGAVSSEVRKNAQARALNLPLGVSASSQGLSGWANWQ